MLQTKSWEVINAIGLGLALQFFVILIQINKNLILANSGFPSPKKEK